MSADAVLLDVDGHVETITLNRPENRNSMTGEVLAGSCRRGRQRSAFARGTRSRDPGAWCRLVRWSGFPQ